MIPFNHRACDTSVPPPDPVKKGHKVKHEGQDQGEPGIYNMTYHDFYKKEVSLLSLSHVSLLEAYYHVKCANTARADNQALTHILTSITLDTTCTVTPSNTMDIIVLMAISPEVRTCNNALIAPPVFECIGS